MIVDTSVTTDKKISRAELFDISDAAGGQIKFPATQNPSSNANTLDDYEEGTWTPSFTNLTVVNGTGGVTYEGTYTKIGRQVFWTAFIILTGTATTASTAGATLINNLPFTPDSSGSPTIMSTCSVVAANQTIANGVGIVSGVTAYTPTWSAHNYDVCITGVFQV